MSNFVDMDKKKFREEQMTQLYREVFQVDSISLKKSQPISQFDEWQTYSIPPSYTSTDYHPLNIQSDWKCSQRGIRHVSDTRQQNVRYVAGDEEKKFPDFMTSV